ncbi:MAG: hypothetical protein M3Y87_06085 [Myxococcota bacterium]|nr:hypothetical protein [Myxococcota bacterium]
MSGRGLLGLGFVVAVLASTASASAQRMDLALSRLRTMPADPSTCANAGGGVVPTYCPDEDAWRSLATQFAGSMIPPVLLPAHTRGMRGIYVGVETSITGIDSSQDYWRRGTEGDAGIENRFVDSVLAWNRLNVRKGLPFGFELGTNVGFLVNTSYWTMGLEIRWSLLEGLRDRNSSVYFPSLSVRGAVQTLIGDSEMHATVPSVDVSLGERFIVGDMVEISPYLGAQLAWIFADSELVDLTPETDAYAMCDPDPMPGAGAPPHCRGDGSDLNHNWVFQRVRSMRARMFVGTQVRYEWFALTSAFSFDLMQPHELDELLPTTLPRQWQVDVGLGVSY